MADGDDSSEKRHRPTRRRLRQARREGQVAKSRDLTAGVTLIGWLVAGAVAAPWLFHLFEGLMVSALDVAPGPFTAAARDRGAAAFRATVLAILGLAAPAAAIGVVSLWLQTGPVVSGAPMAFDLARLNPVRGLAKLFKPEGLVELSRTAVSAAVLAWLLAKVLQSQAADVLGLAQSTPGAAAAALLRDLEALFAVAAGVAVVIGLLDLIYQRFALERRLRMTAAEFKQDRRITDGDPRAKSRRRDLYREWVSHSAVQATRGATVVVTNPTRLAVAVAYDPARQAVPVVAAKGEGPVAALIRAAARDAGIPIIENVPLARSLHARVALDDAVPEGLFAAVAEVIVWANRARDRARRAQRGEAADDPSDAREEAFE